MQIGRLPPHDPAHARIDQSVLVPGCIDGFHARQLKVPYQAGLEKVCQQTWVLVPSTKFGRSTGFPSLRIFSRQRHFSARPPSMHASLDPMVEVPKVLSGSGACHKSASMCTQRISSSAVCGYSSLSIMFLSNVSDIRRPASGSIHVPQNVARLKRELPSRISSSCMRLYAVLGAIPSSGIECRGVGPSSDLRAYMGRMMSALCSFRAKPWVPVSFSICVGILRSPDHNRQSCESFVNCAQILRDSKIPGSTATKGLYAFAGDFKPNSRIAICRSAQASFFWRGSRSKYAG